jgi:hypothetical protein
VVTFHHNGKAVCAKDVNCGKVIVIGNTHERERLF